MLAMTVDGCLHETVITCHAKRAALVTGTLNKCIRWLTAYMYSTEELPESDWQFIDGASTCTRQEQHKDIHRSRPLPFVCISEPSSFPDFETLQPPEAASPFHTPKR